MVLTLLPSDFRFWLLSFGVDTCVLGVDTSIQNAFHRFFDNLIVKLFFFLYDILPWIYMIFVYFYQIQIDELFKSFTWFDHFGFWAQGVDTSEYGVDTFC